jgi:hypothetical protein
VFVVVIIGVLVWQIHLLRRDAAAHRRDLIEMMMAMAAGSAPGAPVQPSRPALAAPVGSAPLVQVGDAAFVPETVAREDARRMLDELHPFRVDPTEANCVRYLGLTSSRRVQAAWAVLERYQLLDRPGQGSAVKWRAAATAATAIPSAPAAVP